jgi:hypothetical protein
MRTSCSLSAHPNRRAPAPAIPVRPQRDGRRPGEADVIRSTRSTLAIAFAATILGASPALAVPAGDDLRGGRPGADRARRRGRRRQPPAPHRRLSRSRAETSVEGSHMRPLAPARCRSPESTQAPGRRAPPRSINAAQDVDAAPPSATSPGTAVWRPMTGIERPVAAKPPDRRLGRARVGRRPARRRHQHVMGKSGDGGN